MHPGANCTSVPGAYPPYGEVLQVDRRGELLDDVREGYGKVQD